MARSINSPHPWPVQHSSNVNLPVLTRLPVLPLLTVLQLIFRWGALVEHEYNQPGSRVVDTTPLVVPR